MTGETVGDRHVKRRSKRQKTRQKALWIRRCPPNNLKFQAYQGYRLLMMARALEELNYQESVVLLPYHYHCPYPVAYQVSYPVWIPARWTLPSWLRCSAANFLLHQYHLPMQILASFRFRLLVSQHSLPEFHPQAFFHLAFRCLPDFHLPHRQMLHLDYQCSLGLKEAVTTVVAAMVAVA
jgi:hypothetical protein